MTAKERQMLMTFITDRQEIAYKRLKNSAGFLEIERQQNKSGTVVDELLHKLTDDERRTIRRHYEGETAKESFALNEVYIQGLRDSVRILTLLGIFDREVCL